MTPQERIRTILLLEKLKGHPEYAKRIGLDVAVEMNEQGDNYYVSNQ